MLNEVFITNINIELIFVIEPTTRKNCRVSKIYIVIEGTVVYFY